MYTKYEHHGKEVTVKTELKGRHRGFCLCYECKKFNLLDRENNCHIANNIYKNCVDFNVVTPVFECGDLS